MSEIKIKEMKTVLTIAGSDSIGGAGLQADLKTMTLNGVYGMSVVTGLTAQNTLGVNGILETTPEFIGLQIDAVFQDIFPDAVKIGAVFSDKIIKKIAEKLQQYKPKNIVIDPVMVSATGAKLIDDNAIKCLIDELFPLADIITPNIPEARVLSGLEIKNEKDMEKSAFLISKKLNCSVLLKGGHEINDANDVLVIKGNEKEAKWFKVKKVETNNTHGTGCTLSSAIASNLAKGYDINLSIEKGKNYLTGTLSSRLKLGKGVGPVDHAFDLNSRYIN